MWLKCWPLLATNQRIQKNCCWQSSPKSQIQNLVEPLSERERDGLRLLDTELNGPEMAHKLMVSLNPLRTHTKNIYSKFGVNNRQAAIHRAAELNLL